MQKITPFLWFNGQAEEAVNFYAALFKDTKVKSIARYGANGPGPEGTVMTISFELFGQSFLALNGGPQYQFTPAVSFVISCDSQDEIDAYWEKLSEGGRKDRCGWLQDKFGLSWQIVPRNMGTLMSSGDGAKTQRVMQAMMQMDKLDMHILQAAFDGTAEAV